MIESAVQSHAEIVVDSIEKSRIRVLYVDDEPALLKVAEQCLELQGPFQIGNVNSVEDALSKLEKQRYDAVVSDYEMPGKDGLEFLEMLRKRALRPIHDKPKMRRLQLDNPRSRHTCRGVRFIMTMSRKNQ